MAVSDRVLSLMPAHSYTLNRLMFVGVNALLLYLVAARYMKTIRISVAAREEALVRARGYFESSVEGIISADSKGIIRQLNPRGQTLFGYHEMELVGQPIEVLVPLRFRYRHEAHRSAFFTAPKSRMMGRGMEVAGRRKDGSEFPAEISLNVVHTHRGKQVIAFVTDITERRAMEREARRNETVDALAAVAAGIAHELNNPLAVMASRIELMLATDPGSHHPDARRFAGAAKEHRTRQPHLAQHAFTRAPAARRALCGRHERGGRRGDADCWRGSQG